MTQKHTVHLHPQEEYFRKGAGRLLDLTPETVARLLRRGGEYADIFYEHTVHHRLCYRQSQRGSNYRPDAPVEERKVVEGTGLRVMAGDQTGFASCRHLSRQALYEAAEEAAEKVDGSSSPAPPAVPASDLPERQLLPTDTGDMIACPEKITLLQVAADAAFSVDSDVVAVEAEYYDRTRCILVCTSEGRVTADATVLMGMRVVVHLLVDGQRVTAYAVDGNTSGFGYFFKHQPEETACLAVTRARNLARGKRIEPGEMPVVIAGGWGGVWLHESVGHLLEADVASGPDGFAGRIGERIAAAGVTLVDDATYPGGRGTAAFDDEGTPAQATLLVDDGVLCTTLTDRMHAALCGQPATGNGRRQDYMHVPMPRMTNLLLQPGQANPEDLIAEVKKGLFVRTVGHGRTVPDTKNFSFDVLDGNLIENGRLGATVKGVRVNGSGPETLRRITGIGRDFLLEPARGTCEKKGQVVPVSVGMPTVLIDGLTVVDGEA